MTSALLSSAGKAGFLPSHRLNGGYSAWKYVVRGACKTQGTWTHHDSKKQQARNVGEAEHSPKAELDVTYYLKRTSACYRQ